MVGTSICVRDQEVSEPTEDISDVQDGQETKSEDKTTNATRQEDGSLVLPVHVTVCISEGSSETHLQRITVRKATNQGHV